MVFIIIVNQTAPLYRLFPVFRIDSAWKLCYISSVKAVRKTRIPYKIFREEPVGARLHSFGV